MHASELSLSEVKEFQDTIYEYYNTEKRTFPWRETANPYYILVSEIMLQQTQTDRVVPKYLSWLSQFPDIETLAQSSLATVLTQWSGLGYNRRAKYLQLAAQKIIDDFDSIFPQSAINLQKLPGVGPYTACAVSTFAFCSINVFIETNIRAVFIFFFFPNRNDVHDSEIFPLIEQTLDRANPRDWYYALMDYGSTLKKKTVNPSRMSKHHVKQSKFEGSVRQARGAILRQLSLHGPLSLSVISVQENLPIDRLETASAGLMKELLVCENEGIYTIRE